MIYNMDDVYGDTTRPHYCILTEGHETIIKSVKLNQVQKTFVSLSFFFKFESSMRVHNGLQVYNTFREFTKLKVTKTSAQW